MVERRKPRASLRGKDAKPWQADETRTEINRMVPHATKDNPLTRKRIREAYKEHPKNERGENVCYAYKKKDKTHCMQPAGKNTAHEGYGKCSFHGGNTPTLSKNAALYMGAEAAERMTNSFGYGQPLDIHPSEALLQEVQRTAGHVFWLQDRIGFWNLLDENGKLSKAITIEQQQWLDLYHKERLHLAKVSKMTLDAGVAERKIQIAEQQGVIMIQVMNRVFDQLGLTIDQRRMIPLVVPQAIREATQPQAKYIDAPEHTGEEV